MPSSILYIYNNYIYILYVHSREISMYITQDPAKVQKTNGGLWGAEATDSQLTVPGVSWLPSVASMCMQPE
jgi:hypothetical protein